MKTKRKEKNLLIVTAVGVKCRVAALKIKSLPVLHDSANSMF